MRESDRGLRWFRGAGVAFHGMPDIVNDSSSKRPVWVMPAGGGGWVDEDLTGLPEAASNLLAVPHVRLRVQKLLNHPAHEHHLFVWLGDGGFPDNVWIAMAGHPRSAPSAPPQTPPGLTHLWLKTDYGSSLIGWSAAGWTIAEVTA